MKTIKIYTDGSCSGNPGPGGWGVLMLWQGEEKEIYGGEFETTNNRMELMAAIQALETLKREAHVDLYTDSKYVSDGITQWIINWKKNNWKNASKKPVKNADLWQRLDEARDRHTVRWHWVKGHSGHPENERADVLANMGMAEYRGF